MVCSVWGLDRTVNPPYIPDVKRRHAELPEFRVRGPINPNLA